MKTCTRCGETKEFVEFYKKRNGLNSRCKSCIKEIGRIWYEENREHDKAKGREWYQANREHKLAKNKEWYEANKEHVAQMGKQRRLNDPEKDRKRSQKYYEAHKDDYTRRSVEWAKANPDKIKAKNARRRERQGKWRTKEIAEFFRIVRERYPFCLRCGTDQNLTIDHIMPITLGGDNSLDNLQVLCKLCNSSKCAKYIDYRPSEN